MITHDLSILAQIADSILVMYAGQLAEKADTDTIVNSPLHPYTQMLLASLPDVGRALRRDHPDRDTRDARRRWPTRRPAAGSRERCPFAYERCAEQPPFQEVRPGHYVACWKVGDGGTGRTARRHA